MSIGYTRRDMLQFLGVSAMSVSIPKRLQDAQKDGKGKKAAGKPLTFFGWSDTHIPVHGDGSKLWVYQQCHQYSLDMACQAIYSSHQ